MLEIEYDINMISNDFSEFSELAGSHKPGNSAEILLAIYILLSKTIGRESSAKL